ncbi:MAG: nitrobenzoate reductase [Magnetovibrio sp.]|nr:nitrobenzoate reductase [Magnetovibrio sp.]|tara:strand:- start:839 stop:1549 length:711 start_codon:yes stop_codon:yes gene_type:complete
MTVITKKVPTHASKTVKDAIGTRRSMRAFLPTPISKEVIIEILDVAQRAPSGTNSQPWFTYVLAGEAKEALTVDILKAFDDGGSRYKSEIPIYPKAFFEPYLGRRRKVGWDLYGLLGIEKGDKAKMHLQHGRNFKFFDAPIGLMFSMHRNMPHSNILDIGMYLQNIMLMARAKGLHTCPQVAFTQYHEIIRKHLSMGEEEIVLCGMTLGYAAPDAIENTMVTVRDSVEDEVKFIGF